MPTDVAFRHHKSHQRIDVLGPQKKAEKTHVTIRFFGQPMEYAQKRETIEYSTDGKNWQPLGDADIAALKGEK